MTFHLSPRFPPTWQRFLAPPPVPPASVPARPLLGGIPLWGPAARDGGATSFPAPAARDGGATGAAPAGRHRQPVEQRPTLPAGRRDREFAWLTWQLPERLREDTRRNLGGTLDWRAEQCPLLKPPRTPAEYTRFGLEGEQLVPIGAMTLCKRLRAELRESIRTLESIQSRTERNQRLAMHSVRLGQLCAELEQRGLDTLEEVRNGLAVLWDEPPEAARR